MGSVESEVIHLQQRQNPLLLLSLIQFATFLGLLMGKRLLILVHVTARVQKFFTLCRYAAALIEAIMTLKLLGRRTNSKPVRVRIEDVLLGEIYPKHALVALIMLGDK